MAPLFQIEGATQLDDRVWKARLSPAEVRLLGPNAQTAGDTTVLLLAEGMRYDATRGQLAFDPTKAKLLNAGTSDNENRDRFIQGIIKSKNRAPIEDQK
jgi:hypothetical protein